MAAGQAAIIAKALSKHGKFLKLDDYKTLISGNDVNDIVSLLQQYPDFKKDFMTVSDSTFRRSRAEQIMNKRIFRIYTEMLNFKSAQKDGFYSFYLKQEEIKQIINAAMYTGAGVHDLFILNLPPHLADNCSFDVMELSQARSYGDILKSLRGTAYYDVLSPLASENGSFPSIMRIDYELTKYLYGFLLKSVKKEFPKSEQEEIRKCILRRCDMYNIKLCYRLRGLFDMGEEQVLANLLPYHYRFDKSRISEVLSKQGGDILPMLLKLPYFKCCSDDENIDIETAVNLSNLHYYGERLRLSKSDAVVLYSLIELLQIENRNLTVVIEGVRYSLQPHEIEKMLILKH